MSYEIPQNLKYREKIFFNLDIFQLIWIGFFSILSGLIYFKAPFPFLIKIILASFLMFLALGFAFFDFFSHIKSIYNFSGSKKDFGFFDGQMSSFLEVSEIKNNCLYLKDGSVKAIIKVKPINFSILSTEEKQAIIFSYKEFLNSLSFPIQICMRTVNLSLDNYLSNLERKVVSLNDSNLSRVFTSFKDFINSFIQEKDVKNRLFFIVVPVCPEFNSFFSFFSKNNIGTLERELNMRVNVCLDKLSRCKLKANRLNDSELLNTISLFFENTIQTENNYFFPFTISSLNLFKEAILREEKA